MRVAGPLPTLLLTSQPGSAWQRGLQPGQVLHAVVVSPAAAGTALMRVGALELIARTELTLTRDQSLLLEVVKAGDQPELRLLRAAADDEVVARALRASLPRPAPPGEQLGRILGAARQLLGDAATAALGREIAGALRNRPVPTGTEPAALRQALAQSGLFLEARLARGQFDAADLKATLLRVLARLRDPAGAPAPGGQGDAPAGVRPAAGPGTEAGAGLVETLRHLVEDSLAGIRWQQISSLPEETGRGLLWHVGLPLRTPDDAPATLWVRAERESDGRDEGSGRWALDLTLTLASLGTLHARLGLVDDRISATIWAERPDTAALLRDHLDLLGAGLERAGLAVGHLAARSGRPATAADQPAPRLRGLLDERA